MLSSDNGFHGLLGVLTTLRSFWASCARALGSITWERDLKLYVLSSNILYYILKRIVVKFWRYRWPVRLAGSGTVAVGFTRDWNIVVANLYASLNSNI